MTDKEKPWLRREYLKHREHSDMKPQTQDLQLQVNGQPSNQTQDFDYQYPTNVSVGKASHISYITTGTRIGGWNEHHKSLQNNIPSGSQM